MRRQRPYFTVILALLAFGWAQVFGVSRGYLCLCGGEQQITFVDHCHGPHSAACHDHEEESEPFHSHEDHPLSNDVHEHPPLRENVLAKQQGTKPWSPAIQAYVIVSEACLWNGLLMPASTWGSDSPKGQAREKPRPPWPHVLAHVIALQV